MFDPKTNKFPYPMDTGEHYLKVKKNNGLVFDTKYPYVDNSKKMKRGQWWMRVLLNTIVFPLDRIRLGLRIKGRENLKKYKDVIDKGIISVSNHIHMWDYITTMRVVRPNKPYVLVWDKNVRGENSKIIRLTRGIPVPTEDPAASKEYLRQVIKLITEDHGWLHIYAEGTMWEFYAPIRPFKRGASYIALKCDKPIIPIAYSYRKPNWIRRVIFRQIACITATIGEPIYKDDSLTGKAQEMDLTRRVHAKVCELAGIKPEENIYDAIYNDSKRIDYYTDTYGVGYKGSH